jgi:quinone-modifying oxidoreductase subunit QmoC
MHGSNSHDGFMLEVMEAVPGGAALQTCLQCGTCGGSCPAGADMDHTPRALFAMIAAGMRAEVLTSNTPWYCVSCYLCTVRCPKDIPITEIMYTLKRMAVREGKCHDSKAPDFSKTFIRWVEENGRSFEFGLMGMHMIRHNRALAFELADMGIGLMAKGRMALTPTRIKDREGLKHILAKAKELEAPA